jgi:transketolase
MEKLNLRTAYGEALVDIGRENQDVVALEADLGNSTMSKLFKAEFPDRYFEMGIAEADMMSTAAGLALTGKLPFASTFAVFASGRAYDQIRCSIAIPRANVKICGSSCGLSDYGDGKTHQSVEDANIMRAMPHMVVLNPVDAVETRKMMRAMLKIKGPVYLRVNRNDLPVYTPSEGEYEIGKIYPIIDGSAQADRGTDEAAIFAMGIEVTKALEAAELLKKDGISASVLNVSTLKPLLKDELLRYARGKKAVIVAEESVRTGGLGQEIASLLIGEAHVKFGQVAIDDAFGTSARNYDELLEYYHLGAQDIYKATKNALEGKNE